MWNGRVVQGHDEHKHELKSTGTEHMVIIMTFGDGSIWLTDVGFGGQGACHPLQMTRLIWTLPRIAELLMFFLTVVFMIWFFHLPLSEILDFVW